MDNNRMQVLLEEFMNARPSCSIDVKEISEQGLGKIVGSFCQYAPIEIIHAAGLHNVILCGFDNASIPLAETELPVNLCPLIKSSYGHILGQTCPFAYFSDLIVGETTCDGKKKMYEFLSEVKDVYIIHLPNAPEHDRSLESWVLELRRFKDVLENKFGVTITDEALRESIRMNNAERILFQRIYELGKLNPPAIRGYDMRKVMSAKYFILDRVKKRRMMEELVDLCMDSYERNEGPYPRDSRPPRIMISGAGLDGVVEKTIRTIDEAGGAIVCYEGCSGILAMRQLMDEDPAKDPLVSIAEKYLDVPCAVMSPNNRRLDYLGNMLDEFQIDGVISVTLHSCNPFDVENHNIAGVCRSRGVPFMHLRTDYTPGDEGQLKTRIEAFLEMLNVKHEGLAAREA